MAASPLNLVDPDLRAALAVMPDLSSLSHETLPQIRATLAAARPPEGTPGLSVEPVTIIATPDVTGLLYRPAGSGSRPAILNLHGGGMVAGTAARDDAAMRILAVSLDAVILSIDYRLAPEAPFPAAIEDSLAALAWLHGEAEMLGVDRDRIALRGTSAGGGIAAGLALMARDRGGPAIALLSLLYPMLDDRTRAHPVAGKHVWPIEANRYGWACYLDGIDPVPIYAAPGRAEGVAGLPPTFIATGALDLFVDENIGFARKLMQAGVPAELHVYPGAYHGFALIGGSRVAQRYERDALEAFRRAFNVSPD